MKTVDAKEDELRTEYRREDFGEMVRGKYAKRCRESSSIVVTAPDIAKIFPTDDVERIKPLNGA